MISLLVGSGYLGLQAMEVIERDAIELAERQMAHSKLIDEMQRRSAALSVLLYSLLERRAAAERSRFLAEIEDLEAQIGEIAAAGRQTEEREAWQIVHDASVVLIQGARKAIEEGARPDDFGQMHRDLNVALVRLMDSSYVDAALDEAQQANRARDRIGQSLSFLAGALLLGVLGAVVCVWLAFGIFRGLEEQAKELAEFSIQILQDHESSARRFSRELHDEFGQTLSALEANLVALRSDRAGRVDRIEDSLALTKEAISMAREMSQLLRPSILDDFGLDASLQWLAENFSQRTGIAVTYQSDEIGRLAPETETHLFRIGQEALTNVSRHAHATEVKMELRCLDSSLQLTINDNGRGLPSTASANSVGMASMRERARAAGGWVEIASETGKGVRVAACVPAVSV